MLTVSYGCIFWRPFKNACFPPVLLAIRRCRDLDLCRDEMQSSDDNQATVWLCHECNHEYDREMIEQELLEVVHQRVMAFQLQVHLRAATVTLPT